MTTNPFRQRHTGPTINPFTGKPNPSPMAWVRDPRTRQTSSLGLGDFLAAGSASVAEGADADHVEALVARSPRDKARTVPALR